MVSADTRRDLASHAPRRGDADRVYILADDLTGASDAGVQFAKRGHATLVWIDADACDPEAADGEVTVIDLDSRASSDADAQARLARLARRLPVRVNNRVIKKIDSTLRGRIGAEVRALLDVLPESFAVVAPAYPKNGRTTVGGVQYAMGRPVHETDIGRDPRSPVGSSVIADLFDEPSAGVEASIVERGIDAVRAAVRRALATGVRCLIFDARDDSELRTIARLYDEFPRSVWVGSAGIIEYLDPLPASDAAPAFPSLDAPLLVVAGSLSETTCAQIETFGATGARVVRLDPATLLDGGAALATARTAVSAAYREGADCVIALRSDDAAREAVRERAAREGTSVLALSDRLREQLAAFVASLTLAGGPARCYLVTGGDTARSLCGALGVRAMRIVGELEPGIPLSRAIGADCLLVTKAGGFGRRETFVHIAEMLRAGKEHHA